MKVYQPEEGFLRSQRFRTRRSDEAIDHRFRFYFRSLPNSQNYIGLIPKPGVGTITEFDRLNHPVATYSISSDKDILYVLAGRAERRPIPLG